MSSRSFGEVGKTGGQRTAYRISQSEQLLPKPITIPALGREPQAGLLSSFELRSMSQPESGSRQILRWRKRASNRRSLFSNDRDLARKQFLYSTVGLVDRCVRVGCGGGVGIGNRDRAEPSAPELMRRLPLRPVRIE